MILDRIAAFMFKHSGQAAQGSQSPVIPFVVVVAALIVIISAFALMVAIWLSISYTKYNHQKNSIGKTGGDIARQVLDDQGLAKLKVVSSGSVLLGNSYSHLFRKIRLRRRLWSSDSVAALAAAVQVPCLAVLSDRDDADMKSRRRVTPLICLGPWALIPLMLVGWIVDLFTSASGWWVIGSTVLAIFLYLLSLVLAFGALKTEKRAQSMALDLMADDALATTEELDQCKKLYRLYTVEYVNNMFLAPLELIYRLVLIFTSPRTAADDPTPTDK